MTQNVEKTSLPIFPFTAIVGQEEMKLALELNVIDPKIGGVIIMGDRGTGKSTTIRAIADLLPKIKIVRDDAFNSHPRSNPPCKGFDPHAVWVSRFRNHLYLFRCGFHNPPDVSFQI